MIIKIINILKIINYIFVSIKIFKFNYLDKTTYKYIPNNSIIFSSYSVHYMKVLNNNFTNYLQDTCPKIIINYEPLYEVHNNNTK